MKGYNQISDLCIRIKNNSQNYKKTVEIINTQDNIKFLNFLYKEGYILYYIILKDFKIIKIFLKYNNNVPLINRLNFISKNKKEINCPIKILLKQKNQNSFYIIKTNNDYLSLQTALKKNIGGYLFCQIN